MSDKKQTTLQKTGSAMLAVALVLSFVFAVSSVYAYLTSGEQGINTFTVGEADVGLVEEFTPPKELVQGTNTYKKNVCVKNTGPVSEFVRVYLAFTSSDIRDISGLSSDGTVYYSANTTGVSGIESAEGDEPGIEPDAYIGHLPEGWVYLPEDETRLGGYYYYTQALAPGESTAALFDSVRTYFKDASSIADYDILIYAESVQAKDRTGADYTGADAYRTCWTEYLGEGGLHG